MKVPAELDEYYRLRPYTCFFCKKDLNIQSGEELDDKRSIEQHFTYVGYRPKGKSRDDIPFLGIYGEYFDPIEFNVLCCDDCQLRHIILPNQERQDRARGLL